MRLLILVVAAGACHPSATVENTMPIANLQTYRSIALRVHSTAFAAQGQAMQLENAVLQQMHQRCAFEQVAAAQAKTADLVLDLNIVNTGRGGGGFISNSSTARLDTLLVISDGQAGDLLGTARIHGESSGMIINNASPELEAIDIVAKTVTDVFAKSGCNGPRIAKVVPPPTPETPPTPVDESHRDEAEKFNEDGKQKVFIADLAGALAAFQQADALVPDPKYEYNLCSTLGLLEKWDEATAMCQKAIAKQPPAVLRTKLDQKIELLKHHQ
jgi:tetratricopeptide (TPR) repeat protein